VIIRNLADHYFYSKSNLVKKEIKHQSGLRGSRKILFEHMLPASKTLSAAWHEYILPSFSKFDSKFELAFLFRQFGSTTLIMKLIKIIIIFILLMHWTRRTVTYSNPHPCKCRRSKDLELASIYISPFILSNTIFHIYLLYLLWPTNMTYFK
jgi:hypothetical protein